MNAPDIFDEQIEQHAHATANRELEDALRAYEGQRSAVVEREEEGRVVTVVVSDSTKLGDRIS